MANFLKIFSKWENNEFRNLPLFLLSFGAFCQQGNFCKTSLISTRCLITFLFLASILSYNFYTSVLVSHLVEVKYESSVNSIDELVESETPIGIFNSIAGRNFLNVCTTIYINRFVVDLRQQFFNSREPLIHKIFIS